MKGKVPAERGPDASPLAVRRNPPRWPGCPLWHRWRHIPHRHLATADIGTAARFDNHRALADTSAMNAFSFALILICKGSLLNG